MGSAAPQPQVPRTRRVPPGPAAGSGGSAGDEPTPTMTIEIAVDVRSAADGTWSVLLTPAVAALGSKRRDGLPSLAAVHAQVRRMLAALVEGGFPVATTWTIDGDLGAWRALAAHATSALAATSATPDPASPHTTRPVSGSEGHG